MSNNACDTRCVEFVSDLLQRGTIEMLGRGIADADAGVGAGVVGVDAAAAGAVGCPDGSVPDQRPPASVPAGALVGIPGLAAELLGADNGATPIVEGAGAAAAGELPLGNCN